jgi:hypothetical protein
MISAATAVAIALVMFAVAHWKGRTGWHWSALSLLAFSSIWLATAVVLHFSEIRVSIASADREFATFVGFITTAIIGILLLAVPSRPRRRQPAVMTPGDGLARRRPPA